MKHTYCSRECSGKGHRGEKRPQVSKQMLNAYKNGRKVAIGYADGYRDDLGISVRSGWEANVARVLNSLGIHWSYEPKAFVVTLDGKECTYTPDFYLPEADHWIEVKGRWIGKAREKYDAFASDHRIMLIDRAAYVYLFDHYSNKVDWERKNGHI